MKGHNLLIECGPMSSDELRQVWSECVESIVQANAHRLSDHPSWMVELLRHLPRYELPRRARNADQAVATVDIVRRRGKATCVEWAAICAADARVAGDLAARAVLVDQVDEYDQPIPGAYHVIVVYGDGRDVDVTQMLPGYDAVGDEWWLAHGHCCRDCALGIDGARTTCQPCAAAQAQQAAEMAGCSMGRCDAPRGMGRWIP